MAVLFPDDSDMLRRAAWQGTFSTTPVPRTARPATHQSYLEEIGRLGQEKSEREGEIRENRLGDYLLILFFREGRPRHNDGRVLAACA